MPNVFDGTNPITDILGDEPTEREVTMENQSTMTIIEPLTNTQIPAGQTVLVRVIGDMAHSTLVNNIQQINALQGFEVIGLTSVVIPDEPVSGGLLVPTGAVESADGDYQRFAYDGVYAIEPAPGVFFKVWHAELESSARQADYQVKVKMPVIDTASQEATVSFAAASITESGFLSLQGVNTVSLVLKYQSSVGCRLRVLQGATVLSSVEITPTPIAGDEITLTLNADSVDYVHGANTESSPVPNGFFSATPNVLAFSGNINPALIVPLSIKVAEAPQQ